MAPVLQCPDCKTKHPLDAVADRNAFPCQGCGRTLKVPEMARTAPAEAPAPVPPPPREQTQAMPVAAPPPPSEPPVPTSRPPAAQPTAAQGAPVAWWMRLLLWIIAVPVSFLFVFTIARASGLFTHEQLTDIFLANGRSRFWPLARLLPIVALVMALIVQGGVVLLSRRRVHAQGSTTRGSADANTPSTRIKRT
jgi:hypothetical protein